MSDDIYHSERTNNQADLDKAKKELSVKVVSALKDIFLLNHDSNRIDSKIQDNGKVSIVLTNLSPHTLTEKLAQLESQTNTEWSISNNAGKPSLKTMIDGNTVEFEIDGALDRSQVVDYHNAHDVSNSLKLTYPSIADKIRVVGDKVEIQQNDINIDFATTAMEYDENSGMVKLPNGNKVEISFTSAMEADRRASGSEYAFGESSAVVRHATQAAIINRMPEEQKIDTQNLKLTPENLSPRKMFEAAQKFTLQGDNAVNKERDGATTSINLKKASDANISTVLKINEMWFSACAGPNGEQNTTADNQQNMEYFTQDYATTLAIVSKRLMNGEKNIDNILYDVENSDIQDKEKSARIILNYIRNLNKAGLSIEFVKSDDEYVNDMDSPVKERKPSGVN